MAVVSTETLSDLLGPSLFQNDLSIRLKPVIFRFYDQQLFRRGSAAPENDKAMQIGDCGKCIKFWYTQIR
jgi:hypothetical protein